MNMVRCEHYALRLAGCRTTARDRPYYMHGFASPTVSCNQWFSSTNGGWLQDDRKGSSLLYAPSLPRQFRAINGFLAQMGAGCRPTERDRPYYTTLLLPDL